MSLSFLDAAEIAWAAFLDEIGEPFVPHPRDHGFTQNYTTKNGKPDDAEHWRITFMDMSRQQRDWYSPWNCIIGRVWVDKRTGHCNVWVNEEYDPLPLDPQDG